MAAEVESVLAMEVADDPLDDDLEDGEIDDEEDADVDADETAATSQETATEQRDDGGEVHTSHYTLMNDETRLLTLPFPLTLLGAGQSREGTRAPLPERVERPARPGPPRRVPTVPTPEAAPQK